jgi:hypothetical protein
MAVYEDGTMDVLKDGKVERRHFVHYPHAARLPLSMPKSMTTPPDLQPVLNDGEDVQYFGTSPTPHIVQVHWPVPERDGTLCERLAADKLATEL